MLYSLSKAPVLSVTCNCGIFTSAAVTGLLICIIPVKMVESTGEGYQNQHKNAAELDNVHDHSPKRDLQGAQIGADCENIDQLQGAEDVGGGEQSLSDEVGVVGWPMLAVDVG